MFILAVTALGLVLPQIAAAEATIGPEATPGTAGLPDGRIYEQVTPSNKWGNQVASNRPAFVSPDGGAVMFGSNGAVAEEPTNSAFFPESVSERTGYGWTTRSATPQPVVGESQPEEYVGPGTLTTTMVPSADLSHLLFATWSLMPYVGAPDEAGLGNNVYLEGPDASAEPEWVGRSLIEGAPGGNPGGEIRIAGGSPDLKTIYFYSGATLFPGASHLYEYRKGVLGDAGVLPDGEAGAGDAEPAAQPVALAPVGSHHLGMISAAGFDNQVSADGATIFFTRKDEAGTKELYARVTAPDGAQSTVLVSQSQLTGHIGEAAPTGPLAIPSTEWQGWQNGEAVENGGQPSLPSYVFASPDGTHAFFESVDRLTQTAPEGTEPKTYDFDLSTGGLEYLPALTGPIVTMSNEGSALLFENTASEPFRLERWTAGSGGGAVTPIAQLPSVSRNACGAVSCVGPAYTSTDGNVVVFETESPIPGFNDGGTHYELAGPLQEPPEEPRIGYGLFPNREVFRYDAAGASLSCLSCPPKGQAPSSDAIMSKLTAAYNDPSFTGAVEITTPGRAVSTDGSTVFFETRQALVPQDTNGKLDVYEWQGGRLYLISSGHDTKASFLVGGSESGDDVFFMTGEGIATGDKDGGAYDIYDARVPRPGDTRPPEATPCEGAVCQGPPSVPQLLGAPASEAFSGAGNLVPPTPSQVGAKSLTRAQKLARALRRCRARKLVRKRKRCESHARRMYGRRAARARRNAGHARHQNGRGNR